jgi:predicted dehydrogenase
VTGREGGGRMDPPLPIGVIGAGRHAAALADHQAPLEDVRIARWAASPGAADITAIRELATRIRAPFDRDWDAVARDPELRAVLVLSETAGASVAAEAALGAGKAVFVAAPAATRAEEVNRLAGAAGGGRGVLLAGGTIRHSPAGREALRLIAADELGPLQSLYASVKLPVGGNGERPAASPRPVLEDAAWDLLDFVVAATPGQAARVHASVDALFGSGVPDTAVAIIRFDNDLIATIEVSRCLPPSIPAAPDGEVEIEVIGGRDTVRLEPGATAVRIHRTGTALRPWLDAPVVSMLSDLAAAADRSAPAGTRPETARRDGVADVRRTVELMDAIRAAAGRPSA